MRRCYSDPEEATEWGACGVALLLLREQTGFTVVERSRRGTGFDYWLGTAENVLFQRMARLEVSDIRQGDERTINARVAQKLRQTENVTGEEATYIAVIEFGQPTARIQER